MGQNSSIQWCHHTFNPWRGCTKVSEGCANCYAEKNIGVKMNGIKWGNHPRVKASESYMREPLKWNRRCEKLGIRERVFCASLADVFDDAVPIEWLAELFTLISKTQCLDWLLLTKRPENITPRLEAVSGIENGLSVGNLWLGFSAENQERYNERWPLIKEAGNNFGPAFLFCSAEPLLAPITLQDQARGVPDWIIVGGESGPMARLCHAHWILDITIGCKDAGASCFVKQLGSNVCSGGYNLGKLKDKKGGDPEEWPESLRVREFPGGVKA